eukprot:scaffold20432_cov70-Phaeocystis_antarctica.AAC.6
MGGHLCAQWILFPVVQAGGEHNGKKEVAREWDSNKDKEQAKYGTRKEIPPGRAKRTVGHANRIDRPTHIDEDAREERPLAALGLVNVIVILLEPVMHRAAATKQAVSHRQQGEPERGR